MMSSCVKDEIDVNIKLEGTCKIIVRGYSVENFHYPYDENRYHYYLDKGDYEKVKGYKIVLANGKTLETGADGTAIITLESGTYLIDKIVIPNGYYSDYYGNSYYDYETERYVSTYFPGGYKGEFVPEDYDYRYLTIGGWYNEELISLYK